ncbi:unnamed protein product [Symbiodinium sp. CCMP2592]|nr:unnamed protein product [Symbiodinium sp. CCMP2592]
MRFLAAWTLSLIAVSALDQDLDHGHQRAHLVQAVESWEGDEVSHRPSPRHAPKAHEAATKREMKHGAKNGKPRTKDTKAKHGPKAAAEVSSHGGLSHHQQARSSHRHRPDVVHSHMEVEASQNIPVTFFQEESEQGPVHQVRVHEREGSGVEVEVAKLSDVPDEMEMEAEEKSDYSEEDDGSSAEDQADDFTLPKADEMEGHQDAAAVADVLSASPASIMRREVHDTELPTEVAAKRWLGLYDFHGKVSGQRHLRRVVLVFVFMGIAVLFMLLALTKADNVIRSVLSHVSLSTEPTGSELQEPVEKKDQVQTNGKTPEAATKAIANLLESSLGTCGGSRKLSREDKEFDADLGSVGALRSRVEAIPVSAAAQVERLLPSAGGYDVTFSKPLSSRQLLRLEAVIQTSADSEPLLAPLTRRPCVLYTANASRRVHGGMPLPVAFASQHTDFIVTLCGSPRVDIRVSGSEVNLFATRECEFAEVLPFPCAPDHWQDFVSAHLSSAGTGSSDNHAMENGLRAKGTAVEFHECCLITGATVTLIGELMRSASGDLTLQPLSQEQVSWKHPSWEKGSGEELELLEAGPPPQAAPEPEPPNGMCKLANGLTGLSPLQAELVNQRTGLRVRNLEDQMAQQQKLQKQLALRHTMTLRANVIVLHQSVSPVVVALGNSMSTLLAAKRNVDGLPELPLAKWEAHHGIGQKTAKGSLTGPGNAGAAWGAAQTPIKQSGAEGEVRKLAQATPYPLALMPAQAVATAFESIETHFPTENWQLVSLLGRVVVEVLLRALELLSGPQAKRVKGDWETIRWFYLPLVPLLAFSVVADRCSPACNVAEASRRQAPSWVDWWWAVALRRVQRSGPVFVKLGQWAATRPDLIPEDVCSQLGHLHDSTEPHSLEHTHKVLRESFSDTWFRNLLIEPEPIGSGCIAQVYRGQLLTGGATSSKASPLRLLGARLQRFCGGACSSTAGRSVEVAVKVVHPQVQRAVDVDLQVLDQLASLSKHVGAERLGIPLMLRQFSAFLKAQTNLETEAQNLRRMKQMLASGDGNVVIPEVFDRWVAPNVLVMSFEEGEPLTALLDSDGPDRPRLEAWRILVDSFWAMVFKYRFVHGDLHPGNILWRPPADASGKAVHARGPFLS